VGGIEYSISEETEPFSNDEGTELMGEVRYDMAQLRVRSSMNAQLKPGVLFHELLHAILYQAGHMKQKESVVLALEYGLLDVLRQNPRLVDYLGLKKEG